MPISQRVPPQSIDAEMSVLGAMLIKKEAITQAQELLRALGFGGFYTFDHMEPQLHRW